MPGHEKTCFFIIPFGRRNVGRRVVDFDRLYHDVFVPAIQSLGYRCLRSDQVLDSGGRLHQRMFEQIFNADLVLADLTTLNANVLYELGVRHALAQGVTLMIRQEQDHLPFDVGHFEVFGYSVDEHGLVARESLQRLKNRIRAAQRFSAVNPRYNDSPVLKDLQLEILHPPSDTQPACSYRYGLYRSDSHTLRVINDELLNIRNIDLWVNSENTHLQMARPIERSISATIRYSGAETRAGRITKDLIQQELSAKRRGTVAPGTVVLTSAGKLKSTHGVSGVLHVAAAVGTPMKGFSVAPDIALCVSNVLDFAEKHCRRTGLESLLLPLLGTGQARGQLERSADEILRTVLEFLSTGPPKALQEISILAQGHRAFDFCTDYLDNNDQVKRLP